MPNLGVPELLLILVVVTLLFGVGRVSKLGGELGSAIREFRRGLNDDGSEDEEEESIPEESKQKTTA